MIGLELKVPGFEDYVVCEDGSIVSYKCGTRLIRKLPVKVRSKISVRAPDSTRHHIKVHKLVASAKYGRWATSNEVVRHKDGDPSNNSIINLEYGDAILNAIDEYLIGRKITTVDYIDDAINKLMILREKMGA